MTSPGQWRTRVAAALPSISGDRFRDDEIVDELAQHCADRAADLKAAGLSDAEIDLRVLGELDGLARRARALRRAVPPPSGSMPPRRILAGLFQDVRFAARLLWRTPAFSAVALLTLVLAIGGATAIYSVVRAVLLRPLPYAAADQLVYVWEVTPRGEPRNVVAAGNYFDWRERATSFAALGAVTSPSDVALTGAGEPRRIRSASLTPSVFDVFGTTTMLYGRSFEANDAVAGGPAVTILLHDFWREQFGASPDIIGKTITVNGTGRTVVGVLPPAVDFSLIGTDLLVPVRSSADERNERRAHNYYVVGRLRDGVTRAAANAEMATIVGSLARQYPKDLTGWGANVAGMRDDNVRVVRPLLIVLMAVATLVLVIACANLANLHLVRATRRSGELAIRAAIGAGFGRIARQLIVEAMILCGTGGALALVAVTLLLPLLIAAAPGNTPYLTDTRIDLHVLLFALAATTICGVLIGLAPALMVRHTDLQPLLRSSRVSPGARQGLIRNSLVAVQVGLALVLIVGASLLVKSMWRLYAVDFGFAPDQVMGVGIDLPPARYATNQAHFTFFDDALTRIRAIPGVTAAASSTGEFAVGSGMTFSFAIEGRAAANPSGREDPVPLQAVTPGFFETMKIPLLRGRTFTAADRSDAPAVVILTDQLARRLFPDGDAIGKRIIFRQGQLPWREIVGIVGDTRDAGLDRDAPLNMYLPYEQKLDNWRWMSWQRVLVRTAGDPIDALPAIRRAVWSIDPDLPLFSARPVVAAYAEQLSQRRFAVRMLSACAALALLLGAIGIYGVLACAVAERRREIGIRRALGANAAHVVGALVRSAVIFAIVGAAAGVAVALVSTRYLSALLFEVEPRDPAMFGAAAAMLIGVAALAAWLPARRATRVNPIETLRES